MSTIPTVNKHFSPPLLPGVSNGEAKAAPAADVVSRSQQPPVQGQQSDLEAPQPTSAPLTRAGFQAVAAAAQVSPPAPPDSAAWDAVVDWVLDMKKITDELTILALKMKEESDVLKSLKAADDQEKKELKMLAQKKWESALGPALDPLEAAMDTPIPFFRG